MTKCDTKKYLLQIIRASLVLVLGIIFLHLGVFKKVDVLSTFLDLTVGVFFVTLGVHLLSRRIKLWRTRRKVIKAIFGGKK